MFEKLILEFERKFSIIQEIVWIIQFLSNSILKLGITVLKTQFNYACESIGVKKSLLNFYRGNMHSF